MFDLTSVQSALQAAKLDGWLLYDFRGLNVLARRVLDIPAEAICRVAGSISSRPRASRASSSTRSSHTPSTVYLEPRSAICAGRSWRRE